MIKTNDIKTLNFNNWLSDMVINGYMHLIFQRSNEQSTLPRCCALDVFFFTQCVSHYKNMVLDYNAVCAFTNRVDIFEYQQIIIPVFTPDPGTKSELD